MSPVPPNRRPPSTPGPYFSGLEPAGVTPGASNLSFVQQSPSTPDLSNLKDCPLPEGWDVGLDFDGKPYFIDHKNKTTTWVDPRDR